MENITFRNLFDSEQSEIIIEALNDKIGKHNGAIKRMQNNISEYGELESTSENIFLHTQAIKETDEIIKIIVNESN